MCFHTKINTRKEMRDKRVECVLDLRKREKELKRLRVTACKAKDVIGKAAAQKQKGEGLLMALALQANGLFKTLNLYEQGKKNVKDQKPDQSIVEGYGSPELTALLGGVQDLTGKIQPEEVAKNMKKEQVGKCERHVYSVVMSSR
jgi:hypothetical protein